MQPDSQDDIDIRLSATQNCADQDAICTSDGRMLFNTTEFTLKGPSSP